jgi:hypothetical protein
MVESPSVGPVVAMRMERVRGMRKEVLAASEWSRKPEPPSLTGWWARSKERAGSSLGVSPRCWKKAEVVASILAAKGDCQAVREAGAARSVLCRTSVARWWAREGSAQNLKRVAAVCLSGMRAMRRRVCCSKTVAASARKWLTKRVEPRGAPRKRVPWVISWFGPASSARARCRWWRWRGESSAEC